MEKERGREGRMDPLYLAASNSAPSRDRHLIRNTLHACAPCKMCREKHRLLYALNEKGGGGGHGTREEKSFLFNPLNDRASGRIEREGLCFAWKDVGGGPFICIHVASESPFCTCPRRSCVRSCRALLSPPRRPRVAWESPIL